MRDAGVDMTNKITTDQIIAAAAKLADYVLESTDQYHEKETEQGVKYYTYYLTAGQEVGMAFAITEFLAGRTTTLEVCGAVCPRGYIATTSAWTIARDISSRATRVLRDENEKARNLAVIESFAKKPDRATHPRSLATRN